MTSDWTPFRTTHCSVIRKTSQADWVSEGKSEVKMDDVDEKLERCAKCGRLKDLQGVAIILGRRTFHLFYLCSQCANVGVRELLSIMNSQLEENKISEN